MAQQHAVAFLALTIFAIMPIATSEEACGDIKGCAAYPQTRDNVLLQMKGSLDLSPKNEAITQAPRSGRYWRILNNADGIGCDGNRWNVKELQFFSGVTQLPTAKDANKAFSDSIQGRGPEWAFDGTANETAVGHSATHWSSAFGAGKTARVSYIGYDFGESVTVDGFKIMQYQTCGTSSVQVQFSDDKSTWSTAWAQETNAAGGTWEDFTQKECPWLPPHGGADNTVLCEDGTYVTDWQCVNGGHRQRVQCPWNFPTMCALKMCGGGMDYCCSNDDKCSSLGGPRGCS